MNKRIRKAALTLVAVCLLFVSIISLNIVDTKALDEKHMIRVESGEKLSEKELEEMIIHFDLTKDYRVENEVSLEELEEKAAEEKRKQEEAAKNVKELTIEQKIERACQKYGVPFDLALAIARYETGWFKSYAFRVKNNPGGLSRNEVPMRFDSIEEGVDAFVGNLSRNYIQQGLTTPKEVGKKYCPRNPKWYKTVEALMTYE